MHIEKLTSRDNARLIRARKIRDGREPAAIFIEGRRLVEEALLSGLVLEECFVAEGFGDRALIEAVSERVSGVAEMPERIFRSVADTENPQGIVVIAERPVVAAFPSADELRMASLPTALLLNEINNPANLGAVLRTAEAAGVAGVITSAKSADVYSPRSLRAAMGASFRLTVWDRVSLENVFGWATGEGLTVTAADAASAIGYTEIDWTKPRLLVFGSEAHGLRGIDTSTIDETIKIPMEANVESLNIAVSAGIILFEALRQRRAMLNGN
jgi:TrmH family RNA methyltransferase